VFNSVIIEKQILIDCATSSGKWWCLTGSDSQNSANETDDSPQTEVLQNQEDRSGPEAALSGKIDIRHGHATAS
jgi:hypothetical protein